MLFLLFLLGCAPKTEYTIARVQFENNGHPFSLTNDQNLRASMTQKEVSLLQTWKNPDFIQYFDEDALQLDAWRIENWYAQHGYIDAKVLGWSVKERPQRLWSPHRRLVVTGHVEEGEQVIIRSVDWDRDSYNLLQRELNAQLGVQIGEPFNWDTLEYAKTNLLSLAQNRSYAYASVDISAEVWPTNCHQLHQRVGQCFVAQMRADCHNQQISTEKCEEIERILLECTTDLCRQRATEPWISVDIEHSAVVDILIHFREGPSCRFDEVQWLSETSISQSILDDQVPFEAGDIFRVQRLSQLQRRLFALNQFSVVTATPVLTGGTDIPVHVSLVERKKREAQVGIGGNVDSGLVSSYVSMDFSHINLGNRLLSLEWTNQVGYAIYPGLDTLDTRKGPTLDNQITVFYPRFIKPVWAVGIELAYELGVQPAYRFSSPTAAPYWSWKQPIEFAGFSSLDAQLSYYYTGFQYLDAQVEGLEETDQLEYIGQQIILDGRNDPVHPRQGRYLSLNTYQAGQWLGGEYSYWKTQAELRYFYPIINLGSVKIPGSRRTIRQWRVKRGKTPLLVDGVLSYRFNVGGLIPYSRSVDGQYAPNAEFFFLGGGSDVRGWRAQYLGPQVCIQEPCTSSDSVVPIGGTAMGLGTFEYRQYLPSDIGFAAFADAGMVWADLGSVQLNDLQPSLGVGGRYISPIGPVRLDFACRVRNDEQFALEDRCRVHFAFSESY